MPEDVFGIAVGKSTYARAGIIVNMTPLEPGWRGVLTIELVNASPHPVKLYIGYGIAQIVFFRGGPPRAGYVGRFQDQSGVTAVA